MQESPRIPLNFVPEAVVQVLTWGAAPDQSPYSHKQIAEWCDRCWCAYLDEDAPAEIERLLPILTDVETQWDLILANSYTIEQLRSQSFESVQMPKEWFVKWLAQVRLGAVVPNLSFKRTS